MERIWGNLSSIRFDTNSIIFLCIFNITKGDFMQINIYKSIHMEDRYDPNNILWKVLAERSKIMLNPSYEEDYPGVMQLFMLDSNVIMKRVRDVTTLQIAERDKYGSIICYLPLKQAEIDAKKEHTSVIFFKDAVIWNFYYKFSDPKKLQNLTRSVIVKTLSKNLPNKHVEHFGNDVNINGNKVAGVDTNITNFSIRDYGNINTFYDPAFSNLYLTKVDEKNIAHRGITGFRNEDSSFTDSKYITDFTTQFKMDFESITGEEVKISYLD